MIESVANAKLSILVGNVNHSSHELPQSCPRLTIQLQTSNHQMDICKEFFFKWTTTTASFYLFSLFSGTKFTEKTVEFELGLS